MDFELAVVVGTAAGDADSAALERQLAAAGLRSAAWSESQAAGSARPEIAEPVLLVLGPGLAHPIVVARHLRASMPGTHILFVVRHDAVAGFRKALSHAPMLGYHWSLAEFDDPALSAQMRSAAGTTRRRAQLRTTLDRANARLAAPRPEGGRDDGRRRNSDLYLANFLAQTRESVLAIDARGHVVYSNASAAALLGVDDGRLQDVALSSLPIWTPAVAAAVARAGHGAGTTDCETVYRRGGVEMVLEVGCSAVRDRHGARVSTSLVIRDASERHRSLEAERAEHRLNEQTLMRERTRVLQMFDLAPGFIALLQGPDHVYELANQAYRRLFGKHDLLGRSVAEVFPELGGQGFFELLDQVYASGEPFVGRSMPVTFTTASGVTDTLYLDFVYQPFADERGAVTGIVCEGSDVTAHKLAQDALVTHQTQLERLVEERTRSLRSAEQALHQAQKLESLGKLTGGVAHDFNNILQVIRGNLDMLNGEFDGHAAGRKRVVAAADAVDRGAKLASQLLAFARKQPLQPLPTSLARIVRDMDSLLRRALGESIEIETVIGGGLWTALVDRNQLENVILNLAINARDAMDGHGRLTLEVGNALLDDHYVQQNAEAQPGQYVMLAVSDTGTGMPPEVIAHAFEPFYTTKPEGKGTGLGLSMAYGFVKQSGGHIKIYSEQGSGTTIRIYLPRVHEAEALVADVRPQPATGGSETVLVVEDDAAVRATVVELLSSLGYRVLKAVDGQSGLNVLQSGAAVDLLFTDVVMPGPLRSTELARLARELHPRIRVLFTSGYTQNAIVHGGRLDPGVELISKPYRKEDLARKVRAVLAKPGAAQEQAAAPAARRVLVVEDNEDARDMLCELLRMLGYGVASAASGEEALALLQRDRADVLLTDVGLPGMSGSELARQAVAADPALKIVFASGYGEVAAEGIVSASLPKPYTLDDLEKVLGRL